MGDRASSGVLLLGSGHSILSGGAQLEPGAEQAVLSSSGDRTACTWDLRKLGPGIKSLASASASNAILSAYYSLDGEAPWHVALCMWRV